MHLYSQVAANPAQRCVVGYTTTHTTTRAATCRAYKLGKRRWSYNQCELLLSLEDTGFSSQEPRKRLGRVSVPPLTVTEAVLIKNNETETICMVSIQTPVGPSCLRLFLVHLQYLLVVPAIVLIYV